ncbi:MAG: hypothetical protein ACI857_000223 [Arenicella sp.]|jgi:hypothetical protein
MKNIFYLILLVLAFGSCTKCNLKGDNVLSSDFDSYGDWELYSEYSATDEFYSRIEDGVLKLKTAQEFTDCQRATHYFNDDFSAINGFQVCIQIKELRLPKKVDIQFYFSLGPYELHADIEKKNSTNTAVIFKVDDKGVSSNLKGALAGGLGNEIESDNYDTNFIQIALCPEDNEESTGEMYIEIESIEVSVL